MTATFNQIRAQYNSQEFPKDLGMMAGMSFSITVLTGLLFLGNPLSALLLKGSIAATATTVEAVARPLVRSALVNRPKLRKAIQIFTPQALVVLLGIGGVAAVPWERPIDKLGHLIYGIMGCWINFDNRSRNDAGLAIVPPFIRLPI